MNFRGMIRSLTVLLIASASPAVGQGTYSQIDVPGAISTTLFGVNTAGNISGSYQDAGLALHGFYLNGGTYTSINYPGVTNTVANGLNDLGQVLGTTSNPPYAGFIYDVSTQTYTTLNCNGIAPDPLSINNSGVIVGFYATDTFEGGFKLVGSNCYTISPVKNFATYIYSVTESGELFGYIWPLGGPPPIHNLAYIHGKLRKLTIPNAPQASVLGSTPSGGTLVGYYTPSTGVTAGFVYSHNLLTTLQFPGSTFTYANGVNSAGEVVGGFIDSSNNGHGFIWTLSTDAAKK